MKENVKTGVRELTEDLEGKLIHRHTCPRPCHIVVMLKRILQRIGKRRFGIPIIATSCPAFISMVTVEA